VLIIDHHKLFNIDNTDKCATWLVLQYIKEVYKTDLWNELNLNNQRTVYKEELLQYKNEDESLQFYWDHVDIDMIFSNFALRNPKIAIKYAKTMESMANFSDFIVDSKFEHKDILNNTFLIQDMCLVFQQIETVLLKDATSKLKIKDYSKIEKLIITQDNKNDIISSLDLWILPNQYLKKIKTEIDNYIWSSWKDFLDGIKKSIVANQLLYIIPDFLTNTSKYFNEYDITSLKEKHLDNINKISDKIIIWPDLNKSDLNSIYLESVVWRDQNILIMKWEYQKNIFEFFDALRYNEKFKDYNKPIIYNKWKNANTIMINVENSIDMKNINLEKLVTYLYEKESEKLVIKEKNIRNEYMIYNGEDLNIVISQEKDKIKQLKYNNNEKRARIIEIENNEIYKQKKREEGILIGDILKSKSITKEEKEWAMLDIKKDFVSRPENKWYKDYQEERNKLDLDIREINERIDHSEKKILPMENFLQQKSDFESRKIWISRNGFVSEKWKTLLSSDEIIDVITKNINVILKE
jgi:hypothetical protein